MDNGSTDGCVEMIEEFRQEHPEIITGAVPNRCIGSWSDPVMWGLERASGDWFAIVGADDIISPDYVANCVKVASRLYPKYLAFHSVLQSLSESGHQAGPMMFANYQTEQELRQIMAERCAIFTPSLFYSIDLYKNGKMWYNVEEFGGASDYDMYCRWIVEDGMFVPFCPHWLGMYYRWNEGQSSWVIQASPIQSKYEGQIRDRWKDRLLNANR